MSYSDFIDHPQLMFNDDNNDNKNTLSRGFGSNCGRRALIVGIDYLTVPGLTLGGCVNDAISMRGFLNGKYGEIRMCVDRDIVPKANGGLPTRQNILQGIFWMLENAKSGDKLFWHYSGHGSFAVDTNRDEIDRRDECLVPLDTRKTGYIVDDTLNAILVQHMKPGVTLHVLFDCCHSGTALDLPYVLQSGRHPITGVSTKTIQKPPKSFKPTICGNVILFSACSDTQYAQEAPADKTGRSNGAMTRAFLELFGRSGTMPTYGQALRVLRNSVSRYGQTVQISSNSFINERSQIGF